MTNGQLFLSIGIPSLTVIVGILLNARSQKNIETHLLTIEGDLRRFKEKIGKLF